MFAILNHGMPHELIGPRWLYSQERRELDAYFARCLRVPAFMLTAQALRSLKPLGYGVFTQTRLGIYNIPFSMLKVQTMESTDEPHIQAMGNHDKIHPVAQIVRKCALDELIQIIHVSDDPKRIGTMAFIGTHRPQLPEELHMRERTLTALGFKDLAREYMKICDITQPAVFAPESFAKLQTTPATPEYYRYCAELTVAYFNNASCKGDMAIFAGILATGARVLAPQPD